MPIKVLVVDDEDYIRDLLLEIFASPEYEIVVSESGEVALQEASKAGFQIALIDLKLPGMNGLEMLRSLKQISPATVPIIMTGYPTLDSAVEALRQGAYDYLIKPFRVEEIREVVKRAAGEQNLKSEITLLKDKIKKLEKELHKQSGV